MARDVAQDRIRDPVAHRKPAADPSPDLGGRDADPGRPQEDDPAAERRIEGRQVMIPSRDDDQAREPRDLLGVSPRMELLEAVLAHDEIELAGLLRRESLERPRRERDSRAVRLEARDREALVSLYG